MDMLRRGYVTAPLLGILWMFAIATTVAIAMSFATGSAFRPSLSGSVVWGGVIGLACLHVALWRPILAAALVVVVTALGFGPMVTGDGPTDCGGYWTR